jgi:hypothetical protein
LTKFFSNKDVMNQIHAAIETQYGMNDAGGSGEGGGSYVRTYTNADMDCLEDLQKYILQLSCAVK